MVLVFSGERDATHVLSVLGVEVPYILCTCTKMGSKASILQRVWFKEPVIFPYYDLQYIDLKIIILSINVKVDLKVFNVTWIKQPINSEMELFSYNNTLTLITYFLFTNSFSFTITKHILKHTHYESDIEKGHYNLFVTYQTVACILIIRKHENSK